MRLFIALALPPPVIAEIERTQQRLQRGAAFPVRWVAPASIHLTLQFLGEVADDTLPTLIEAVEQLRLEIEPSDQSDPAPISRSPDLPAPDSRLPAPTLRLARAGAFPSPRRPQTIWMGVAGDLAGLERLYRALTARTALLGFTPDPRPFQAHLTMGRVRRDARPPQVAALAAALAALPPPAPLAWQSGPPILYQSTLTAAGPIYKALTAAGQ